jgi:hypothetical protein
MKALMPWIAACSTLARVSSPSRVCLGAPEERCTRDEGAPVTKALVIEMIMANLDHFGWSYGIPRPNRFSAPV